MDLGNKTQATEVILLGFTNNPEINAGLFVLFAIMYLVIIIGNGFIICVIIISPHLHTPMYFFLCNLAVIDLCYSTNTLPRLLVDLLSTSRSISVLACGVQLYFGVFLANIESWLLVVMSYDRYNAICKPLYYSVIMRWSNCYRLITFIWLFTFSAYVFPGLLQPMRICYPNWLNHFTCEALAVNKLTCDRTRQNELVMFSMSFFSFPIPFSLIIVSYVCIIASVLKLHSAGRSRAFSTCTSHVIVVILFYGTAMVMNLGPSSHYLEDEGKYITIFYGNVIPMLNPIIYSLKNTEVKKVFLLKRTTPIAVWH